MVWIAVSLPLLPLEAVRPLWPESTDKVGAANAVSAGCHDAVSLPSHLADESGVGRRDAAPLPSPHQNEGHVSSSPSLSRPCALIVHARVALADAQARALGVRRGFARSHALALAPNLECLNPDLAREQRAFEAVALALCAYTPQVVLAGAHTILLDVTASLRLFGGLRALWRRLVATLEASGHRAVLACAPTPWAAWLFAQAGVLDRRMRRVVKPVRLARLLDTLPVMLLPAAAEHRDGLLQIGCDSLGAVRRLPRGGVTRRFGRGLLDTLAQTYGEAPDPREYFEPPPVFEAKLELMARVEHAEALLFAVRRLLQQLVGWLTARHAGVSRFTLTLVHETARHGDPRASALTIAWSTPARDLEHLVLMSREKLHRTELVAPVIELHLSADDVSDYEAPTDTLFPLEAGGEAGHEAMARLLERLVARLGAEKVREIALQADHRPESAMTKAPYAIGVSSKAASGSKAANSRRNAERRFAAQRAFEQEI
ncbi:MAG TPA: DNA polymerase Y family protein, partial [Pararobbsia sp.]|nr:DNA polymerase Y family protein [Pararobbsia sp.]